MAIKKLIILFFIGHFTALFSQTPMVAYRKEGIWYYFDTNGKSMWAPFMDVAGFPSGWCNGLLKASAMEITGTTATSLGISRQQVLYNVKGEVVFRPKIKGNYRITSGMDKAGYFQIMATDEGRVILCDKAGNVVYECPNATGQYLGDGVVAYLNSSSVLRYATTPSPRYCPVALGHS